MKDSILMVSLMMIVFDTIFTLNVLRMNLAKEKFNLPFYCIELNVRTPI